MGVAGSAQPSDEVALRDRVAVNLSPLQFGSADLVKTIETILLDTGLSASRLELGITEGLLM